MSEAVFGFVGGLLGAVLGVLGTIWASEYKHASDVVQKRLDLRLRQLNEFYGPLYIQRRRAEAQRRQLPDTTTGSSGETIRWRLVDHIAEVKDDPAKARAVETILDAGDEIEAILMESSGLVAQDRMPESFDRFVEHHIRLRESWSKGQNQPKDDQLPFPGGVATGRALERCGEGSRSTNMDADIDCAINLGLEWVRDDIAAITTLKDFKGKPLFEPMEPVPPVD